MNPFLQASPHLHVTCQPSMVPGAFVFGYRVENRGAVAALVMDAMPSIDAQTGAVRANPQATPVILLPNGSALLGKFIAPLPQDRRLLAPDLPLCVRLEPGEALERELRVVLPFAEGSPYFPDLRLRDYEPVEAQGVILAIGYWLSDTTGLHAAPAQYAPEHLVVAPSIAPVIGRLAWHQLPTRKMGILRRKGHFPRELLAHSNE